MEKNGSAPGVEVAHYQSGGVYAKQVKLAKGRILIGHKHKYDHLSILASGAVKVDVGGMSVIYIAPIGVHIAAGKVHEITALEKSVWYCVHSVPSDLVAQDASLIVA
jgi:quercetin dioxygenase-like cupin family protein